MNDFTGYGRTNHIDFGDYVVIEQKRYGVPNEMYLHKVIGSFASNSWVEVPVHWKREPKIHKHAEMVLNVVCCGVVETNVFTVREKDCVKVEVGKPEGGKINE